MDSLEQIKTSTTTKRTYILTKEILFIVSSKHKEFLIIFTLIFIPALLFAILSPSWYKASGKFTIIIPEQLDPLRKETFYDYQARAERLLQDQKEIILSDRVLRKAIEYIYPNMDAQVVSKVAEKLRNNTEMTPPRGANFRESSIFYVSYVDTDPDRAATVANAICNAYIEIYNEITRENSTFSFNFLKDQTDRLYNEMREAEEQLKEYEKENAQDLVGILNLDPQRGTNLETGPGALLTQFYAKYYESQEKLAGIIATVNALEKEHKSIDPAVPKEMQVVGHAITMFKSKIAQLEIQINELRSQFTDQFPVLKQVEKERMLNLSSLKEELSRTIRAQKITAEAMSAEIKSLEKIIESLKDRIKETATKRATYEQLRRQYEIAKETYIRAKDRLEQARVANSLNQAQQILTFVDRPSKPLKPFKPKRLMIVALGFLAGFLFALAAVVTLDFLDHSIKKPEDIKQHLGVPFVGFIPRKG